MREHRDHQAGTASGCLHCVKLAYEPSWYASLLAFSRDREMLRPDETRSVTT